MLEDTALVFTEDLEEDVVTDELLEEDGLLEDDELSKGLLDKLLKSTCELMLELVTGSVTGGCLLPPPPPHAVIRQKIAIGIRCLMSSI